MREILFRGKRVDNGEWVEGYYVEAKHHWHARGRHKDWIIKSAASNGGWFVVQQRYAVDPSTVGQYTGLTDKNGKKIFEGDIVKDTDIGRGVVTFGTGTFDSGIYRYQGWHVRDEDGCVDHHELYIYDEYNEIEVIGNIHDNPELIAPQKGGGGNG